MLRATGLLQELVLGFVQVTLMAPTTDISKHTDPARYGDVIVTFTTAEIEVTMHDWTDCIAGSSQCAVTL